MFLFFTSRFFSRCSYFIFIFTLTATLTLANGRAFAQTALSIISVSLDRPTLHVLGVQMLISGDTNRNAKVAVRYREVGSSSWRDGLPLFRVFPETVSQTVPQQFAGSIFDLTPDTSYEIELHATDPDGPVNNLRTITGRTRPVPRQDPATPRTVNVNTASGLQSALTNAVAGDVIVIANGTYTGALFEISRSGTVSNPIVIRGQSAAGVILDGQNCASCSVIKVSGSYIHIENLTIRNAWRAIKYMSDALTNNVVRRVWITDVVHGMDGGNGHRDFYIADNVIEGRVTWADVTANNQSIWGNRGVGVNGNGHVISHNILKAFGDPIYNGDLLNRSFDVYGNDFSLQISAEMDRSAGNARIFHNRFTNVHKAISFQPVHGGPVYALRNVALNIVNVQLKFQTTGGEPSGMLVYHNTFVSHRALYLATSATSHNFDIRNNLFVGPPTANRTVIWGGGIDRGKFDFNGYFPDGAFEFDNQSWPNFAALNASGVFEENGTLLSGPIFAQGFVGPTDATIRQDPADFTLAGASNAHDRGALLAGINMSYTGTAPDLGALEAGCPVPIYGPRPLGSEHLTSLIDCNPGSTAPDGTPAIFSVGVPFITSSGATITWATDEVSDSQVEYGTTTAYGSTTTLNISLVTSHLGTLSGLTPNTLYHYRVKSRNQAGNLATSGAFTFTTLPLPDTTLPLPDTTLPPPDTTLPPPDTTPPTVSISSSLSEATVSGTITVSANASDNVGIVGVQFKLDGVNLASEEKFLPYAISWNTTTVPSGSHTLTAVARDAAGNTSTSAPVTITVANDTAAPTVSITAPSSGSTVSGIATLTALASDNVGIAGVQFKVDGVNLGAEEHLLPYEISWNTTAVSNGSHTLTAVARDAAGNLTTSAPITVTVADQTAPTVSITAPASSSSVSGTITVSANASDNVGIAGVQFKLDGVNLAAEERFLPYAISWNTTTVPSGSHTLTAVARDAAGNLTTSAPITVTVADKTVPTVSITAPTSSSTVSGTIKVSANASDNVGIAGVQFKLDGVNLNAEEHFAPYEISWDTTKTSIGSHTLTAVATDAAGNSTTSTAVSITVANADLVAHQAAAPITVDGVLNEWSAAAAVEFSGLSNGATGYLMWDANHLYVAFKVTDSRLSSLQTSRDSSALWQDDSVEVYIDALRDRATTMQTDDYQFMVNLNNAQRDSRGTGAGKDPTWNGMWASAVTRTGTLNSHTDTDSGYTVEMAIPWTQLGVTPTAGMSFGLNLAVNDSDPAAATTFNTFDWARIAPNSYAQPHLWKWIQLVP